MADAFDGQNKPVAARYSDRPCSVVRFGTWLQQGHALTLNRPQVRQLLFEHPQEFSVGPLIGAIGIAWPYADDACHYWDIEAGFTRMTPLFENTVADLNNWTLDPKILEIMPQLESMILIKPMQG